MVQRYIIFANGSKLVLINEVPNSLKYKQEKTVLLRHLKLKKELKKLYKGRVHTLFIICPNKRKMIKEFKDKIKVVKAGGGIVFNEKKEVLFIKRRGKWDLPKGKADKGETISETALREVTEETGVENLKITKRFKKTYHIFKQGADFRLKQTTWFLMQTDYNKTLMPQAEEGITKVAWKNKDQAMEKEKKMYQSILLLLRGL